MYRYKWIFQGNTLLQVKMVHVVHVRTEEQKEYFLKGIREK